jgi:hypothetical protein
MNPYLDHSSTTVASMTILPVLSIFVSGSFLNGLRF